MSASELENMCPLEKKSDPNLYNFRHNHLMIVTEIVQMILGEIFSSTLRNMVDEALPHPMKLTWNELPI